MNRKMHKSERQMSDSAAKLALQEANNGILAVNGDDGYPYAVGVNYIYQDGKIYIHSAKYGYKIDAIKANNKVCFTCVVNSKIIQNKFTTAYKSVVVTGRINIVKDDEIRKEILKQYIYNMTPDFAEMGMKYIEAAFDKTELLCIDVETLTGKENLAPTFDR